MNNLEKFLSKKGQIVSLIFKRPLRSRVAFKGLNLEKRVKMTARAGVDYDNINDVQEKRESGEIPATNQGLKWGTWEKFPYTILHNQNRYLRFSTLKNNNNKIQTEYFINGQKTTLEQIREKLLASELEKNDDMEVFNVREDYIEEIR